MLTVPDSSHGDHVVFGTQDAAVAELMSIKSEHLLAMLPPLVVDQDLCSTVRQQPPSKVARTHLLQNQGNVSADDEIWWHLQSMGHPPDGPPVVFLDPVIATSWIVSGNVGLVKAWCALQPVFSRVVSVVLVKGH